MERNNSSSIYKWKEWNNNKPKQQFNRKQFIGLSLIEKNEDIKNLIYDMVDHILLVSNPVKILLFGSRARGDAKLGSDIDLVVIFKNKRECITQKYYDITNILYMTSPISLDIKTTTINYYKNNRENMADMYYYAAKDSIILYQQGNEDLYLCLKKAKTALDMIHTSPTKNNSLSYVSTKMSLSSVFLAHYIPRPDNISDLYSIIKHMPINWNIKNYNKNELDRITKTVKSGFDVCVDKNFEQSYKTSRKIYKSVLTECIDHGLLTSDQIKELQK